MPKKKNILTCAYGGFTLLSTIQVKLADSDEQTYTISSNINTFPEEIAKIISNLEINQAIFTGIPESLKGKINEQLKIFNYDKNNCEVKYL